MKSRHFKGRGLLLDGADVSRDSFISRDSVVQGRARVRDAKLLNGSCADEDCQIFGGTLDRAYVGGRTIVAGNALLAEETIVQCQAISGSPKIYHSKLAGVVEVFDSPMIAEVHLVDGIQVYGDAQLIGPWQMAGFARIHEGIWTRPPLYYDLGHAYLNECVDGKLMIECRCRTRAYWLAHGPAFGLRCGWTEEQIEQMRYAIENFEKVATYPTFAY